MINILPRVGASIGVTHSSSSPALSCALEGTNERLCGEKLFHVYPMLVFPMTREEVLECLLDFFGSVAKQHTQCTQTFIRHIHLDICLDNVCFRASWSCIHRLKIYRKTCRHSTSNQYTFVCMRHKWSSIVHNSQCSLASISLYAQLLSRHHFP